LKLKQVRFVAVIAVLALRLVACGGNPAGPSNGGVTLEGTVVGSTFGSASVRNTSAPVLTVVVDGHPAMTTTIGADGRFTLRGLPEGSFTLLFLSDGAPIGQLTFNEVKPNQALTVTVSVASGSVTLVEQRRNGIGHGDLEIEGRVQQVVVVNPTGDSRFVIDGHTVIARPGQTSIRDGNRPKVAAELLVGQQVHVKGVWLTGASTAATQEVLAWEIKMQGDVPTTGPSPSPSPGPTPGATCMINGGRVGDGIELEGKVASGGLPTFMMNVNGNRASGPVRIQAGSAAVRCNGNKTTPVQCQESVKSGAKIHVRGTLSSCDTSTATVAAGEVKVQN
jgi:hypothetical protein